MLNGFDRLIIAAQFTKVENYIENNSSDNSNRPLKIIRTLLQRNPNNFLQKFKQMCSYYKQDQNVQIAIKDDSIMNVISRDLDPESCKILSLLDEPQTPFAMFLQSKIPLTTLYRKINRLERDGLIVRSGIKQINKYSKSTIYTKTFDDIVFQIGKQNIVILTIKNSVLESSMLYTAMK